MTKQEAIDELRREADELEKTRTTLSGYAENVHKAKIKRAVADKLEQELIAELR